MVTQYEYVNRKADKLMFNTVSMNNYNSVQVVRYPPLLHNICYHNCVDSFPLSHIIQNPILRNTRELTNEVYGLHAHFENAYVVD